MLSRKEKNELKKQIGELLKGLSGDLSRKEKNDAKREIGALMKRLGEAGDGVNNQSTASIENDLSNPVDMNKIAESIATQYSMGRENILNEAIDSATAKYEEAKAQIDNAATPEQVNEGLAVLEEASKIISEARGTLDNLVEKIQENSIYIAKEKERYAARYIEWVKRHKALDEKRFDLKSMRQSKKKEAFYEEIQEEDKQIGMDFPEFAVGWTTTHTTERVKNGFVASLRSAVRMVTSEDSKPLWDRIIKIEAGIQEAVSDGREKYYALKEASFEPKETANMQDFMGSLKPEIAAYIPNSEIKAVTWETIDDFARNNGLPKASVNDGFGVNKGTVYKSVYISEPVENEKGVIMGSVTITANSKNDKIKIEYGLKDRRLNEQRLFNSLYSDMATNAKYKGFADFLLRFTEAEQFGEKDAFNDFAQSVKAIVDAWDGKSIYGNDIANPTVRPMILRALSLQEFNEKDTAESVAMRLKGVYEGSTQNSTTKSAEQPQNIELQSLIAGDFDDLDVDPYLAKITEISDAMGGDIEPLKEPMIRYIEKRLETA